MKIEAGKFEKFYDPSTQDEQWYINDHSIIKGDDGWHLFGITHKEPADPLDEKCCAHAIGKSLDDHQWVKQPFPIVTDPSLGEAHFWAPHVIKHDGLYYMFWCAGNPTDHSKYQLMVATSKDLYNWTRIGEVNPIIIDGFDARDPMVIFIDGKWRLYYTANSQPTGGNHLVACVSSDDLLHWSDKRVVFTDVESGTYGGPCESPFVISYNDKWYLFIGPRNGHYNMTEIFESEDPFDFKVENKVGEFPAHAAEVIKDGLNYYVTRAGWGQGGVYIAPLKFK